MSAHPNLRAVLCGYYGMGNAGDEALLVSLLQMLPAHIEPIVLSKVPHQTRDRYGVQAYDRWKITEVIKAFRQADYFIWGGGSLMQDTSSAISPLYYAGLMQLAQWMGLKTIAWAQGIGPLHRRYNRWMTRHVLKRCVAVSVRDRGSADLLEKWGIHPTIAPDPVWAMEADPNPVLPPSDRPRVAVNLRQHRTLTPDRLAVITRALQRITEQTQAEVLLLPFQESLDRPLAEHLQTALPSAQLCWIEDPQRLKGLFRQVDLTIAMRLHAVIMATSEGCRCFALSYDPKVSQVMQSVNLPGQDLLTLPEDPSAADRLSQTWIDLLQQPGGLSTSHRKTLRDHALKHRDLLRSSL